MEPINAANFLEEEWESLSKMFSLEDSNDSSLHFGSNNFFSNVGESSQLTGVSDEGLCFVSNTYDPNCSNPYYISQGSNSSEIESINTLFTNNDYCGVTNNNTCDGSMSFFSMDCQTESSTFPHDMMEMETLLQLKEEMSSKMVEATQCDSNCELIKGKNGTQEDENSWESPKKKRRYRTSKDNGQKNKRPAAPARKNKKLIVVENSGNVGEEEEERNGHVSNSNCGSDMKNDDDFTNASQLEVINEGNSTINNSESKGSSSEGKARASRGSATDPQSLYARRRRERINERLRILQNLVPNGTKVDISTMLEEAVHYVKFLQLQIKLLSSDDLWMFAPIAYNGMDIGLYNKITANKWSPN